MGQTQVSREQEPQADALQLSFTPLLLGKNDNTVLDLVRRNGKVSLDVDGVVGDGV